jgi:hypothetical protein
VPPPASLLKDVFGGEDHGPAKNLQGFFAAGVFQFMRLKRLEEKGRFLWECGGPDRVGVTVAEYERTPPALSERHLGKCRYRGQLGNSDGDGRNRR